MTHETTEKIVEYLLGVCWVLKRFLKGRTKTTENHRVSAGSLMGFETVFETTHATTEKFVEYLLGFETVLKRRKKRQRNSQSICWGFETVSEMTQITALSLICTP